MPEIRIARHRHVLLARVESGDAQYERGGLRGRRHSQATYDDLVFERHAHQLDRGIEQAPEVTERRQCPRVDVTLERCVLDRPAGKVEEAPRLPERLARSCRGRRFQGVRTFQVQVGAVAPGARPVVAFEIADGGDHRARIV